VLEPFDASEAEQIEPRIVRAVDAIDLALEHGISVAMDRYNRTDPVIETD
jgi:peptidyl-tRNA hydrolase